MAWFPNFRRIIRESRSEEEEFELKQIAIRNTATFLGLFAVALIIASQVNKNSN